jgi:hypothetical protein
VLGLGTGERSPDRAARTPCTYSFSRIKRPAACADAIVMNANRSSGFHEQTFVALAVA